MLIKRVSITNNSCGLISYTGENDFYVNVPGNSFLDAVDLPFEDEAVIIADLTANYPALVIATVTAKMDDGIIPEEYKTGTDSAITLTIGPEKVLHQVTITASGTPTGN